MNATRPARKTGLAIKIIATMFALVTALLGVAWAQHLAKDADQDKAIDKRVSINAYNEFKDRVCEDLKRIDSKLDRLLERTE